MTSPLPDPTFSGNVQAFARITDLVTDTVIAATRVILQAEANYILDQVGNMSVKVPLGEPGTGITQFAQAMIDAVGSDDGTIPPHAYLLELSFDGGISFDSRKLIIKPERTLDPTQGMVIQESGNDLWDLYSNLVLPRLTMRNVLLSDAINGVKGQIVAQPYVTEPLGYNEGAGIMSAGGILPSAQGIMTFQPASDKTWAGQSKLVFTAVIDDGTTTPILGGTPTPIGQLTLSVDTNHDSVGKALDTTMKSLAGVEGTGYRGHYVADPSDASLNITGTTQGLGIGIIPDSGLTFVSSSNTSYVTTATDIASDMNQAEIVKGLVITPGLDQRYYSAQIMGGTSNAEVPLNAQITSMAVITPNFPLFGVYVNPGQGGIYTTVGDDRAVRVSAEFGVHDAQVRHPTQTIYAATDAGVYSASTIPANLLGGQPWTRVGALLGSVTKLQLIGKFASKWTEMSMPPISSQPTIPSGSPSTYESTVWFYPGDTSAFKTLTQNDPRFSAGAGTYPTTHPTQYAAATAAGATFFTANLPTPPAQTTITDPLPAKPPSPPGVPPVTISVKSQTVSNAVFALVTGSQGGNGLYMYPGVQDQTLSGNGVLGNNLTYDSVGQLVGVDYANTLSQLSGHAGWDKIINTTVTDFGVMTDGTIIWIEQQGATQLLRTDGVNTEIIYMSSGTGINKIITSPAVDGAWIVPSGGLEALYFVNPGMGQPLVALDTDGSLNQPTGVPATVTGLTSVRRTINGQYVDNIVLTSTGFFWNSKPSGGGWQLGTSQGGLTTTNLLFMAGGSEFTLTDDATTTISPMFATDGNVVYQSYNGGINWRQLGGESLNLGPFFADFYLNLNGVYPPWNPFTTRTMTITDTDLNNANPGTNYQWIRTLDNYNQFEYALEETNSTSCYQYTQVVSNLSTDQNVTSTLASDQLGTVTKRWLLEHQRPLIQMSITSYFTNPAHLLRTLRPMMKVALTFVGTIPNDSGGVTYVNYQNKPFYVLSHTLRYGGNNTAIMTTTKLSSELQQQRLTPDQMMADLTQLTKEIVLRPGK